MGPTMLSIMEKDVLAQLRSINWAPVIFTSANSGHRVTRVIQSIISAGLEHQRRIPTATVNIIISEMYNVIPPTMRNAYSTLGKIYYGTQVGVMPPTFVMLVNNLKSISKHYRLCIEKQIRLQVGYNSTPIK